MDAGDILKVAVQESINKSLDAALRDLSINMVDNIKEFVTKPQYSLDAVLTEKEVAEYLKVSEATLRQWRFQKKNIEYISISNKSVRYKFSDVLAYINARSVKVRL